MNNSNQMCFENATSTAELETNENAVIGKKFCDGRKLKCIPLSDNQNTENIQQCKVIVTNNTQNTKKRKNNEGQVRIKTPQAIAVARRNARERNRVKQVNNGFASLRKHIPESIAKCFEEASNKNSAKKLSKVETLRMAVEYIRQLESMLGDTQVSTNMSTPETPPPEMSNTNSQTCFYEIKPTFKCTETEIAIINGQQYVRIPGTNTFQLISTTVDDEVFMKSDLSDLCMVQNFSQSSMDSEILSLSSDICMDGLTPPFLKNIKEEPEYL